MSHQRLKIAGAEQDPNEATPASGVDAIRGHGPRRESGREWLLIEWTRLDPVFDQKGPLDSID